MKHKVEEGALNFGHEFHGHEHHFLLTREALEFMADEKGLGETAVINTYNAHLKRIHAVAERLSKGADPLDRIVLERSAFD